jgi:hypothetical protein
MEKTKIDTFIKKYNIGGNIESAKWTSDTASKTLKTVAATSDKKCMAMVEMANFDAFGDAEIGVNDATKLKTLIDSIVGEQITVDLITDKDDAARVQSLVISDGPTEVNYVTADKGVIEPVAGLKTLPVFDVEIKLTDMFIDRFLKAKAALPEASMFTLVMSKKRNKLEMVIGFSTINNNRSALEIETEPGKDTVKQPINFSADRLKAIIQANPEVKNAVLKISEKGLAAVDFSGGDYKTQYYLVKMDFEE